MTKNTNKETATEANLRQLRLAHNAITRLGLMVGRRAVAAANGGGDWCDVGDMGAVTGHLLAAILDIAGPTDPARVAFNEDEAAGLRMLAESLGGGK